METTHAPCTTHGEPSNAAVESKARRLGSCKLGWGHCCCAACCLSLTPPRHGRGPTGAMQAQLAEYTLDPEQCQIIMAVLEWQLRQPPHLWRCVYKALTVLEYLLR